MQCSMSRDTLNRTGKKKHRHLVYASLLDDGLPVVSLVPLTERSSVDLDDASLDNGVGPDKLVVRGVVDDTNDTGLAGRVLGSPGEVARLETEARCFSLPPRVRTVWIRLAPSLVICFPGISKFPKNLSVSPQSSRRATGSSTDRSLATCFELTLLAVVGALGPLLKVRMSVD